MPNALAARIENAARCLPLAAVEDTIDRLPLRGDEKAALRLLAWSHQPRHVQRRLALETLEHLQRVGE